MSYKFDALVSILNWLESGKPVTPAYIQEQLEISQRTSFRYLQTLEGAGFPIYFDKKKGSYRFMEGYSLHKLNLTASETLALMMTQESLKNMGAGLDTEIRKIVGKLAVSRRTLPEHIIIAADEFNTDIQTIFATVNDAIVSRQQLEFTYNSVSSGTTSTTPC